VKLSDEWNKEKFGKQIDGPCRKLEGCI